MDTKLETKLRAAYPSGEIKGLSEDALRNKERDERVNHLLAFFITQSSLHCTPDSFDMPSQKFALTQIGHPEFDDWVWRMDNSEKLDWINHAGQPYPVLWLKLSRIADFYDFFFNLWVPRGDTGYLDANFTFDPPNPLWVSRLQLLRASMAEFSFEYLPKALAHSDVPFVVEKDYDSIPEDDPRWDDESFEPPDRPASLYECLFGY